jgi:hypothetical protein
MSSSLFADCCIDWEEKSKPLPEKYYIYAEDRKGSYLIPIYESEDCNKVIDKLQKITCGKFHPRWGKQYTFSAYLGPCVDGVYKDYKEFNIPYVQFTITHGRTRWETAVCLIFDIKNKKMYYNKNMINLHYIKNSQGYVNIDMSKEWDNKLSFKKKN